MTGSACCAIHPSARGAIPSDGGSVGTVESLGIGADYGIAPNQLVKEVLWKALTDRRSVMRE
jgi:hypothetical protein